MNKQVTIVLAVILVLSAALFAPTGAEASGSGEERNIRIEISGGDVCEADEDPIVVKDGTEIKIIKAHEGCGFIGINMEDLTENIVEKADYPQKTGVLVIRVVGNSAAEKAGLEKGDIIYMFDGEKVTDSRQLAEMVMEKEPGDEVEIVFYRKGEKKELKLELGERKYEVYSMDWEKYGDAVEKYTKAAVLTGKGVFAHGWNVLGGNGGLGLVLKDMNEDLASYFDIEGGAGALVIEVTEESPADKAGVKAGDVIVTVGGEEVSDAEDVMDEIYEYMDEKEVGFVVVRKGEKKKISLELGDEFRFMVVPAPHVKRIEIEEPFEKELLRKEYSSDAEKKALEKEIEVLRKEIKKLEKRLEKIEKD